MAVALAAGALLCAGTPAARASQDAFPAEPSQGIPSVTVAVLPSTDGIEDFASVRGLALGQLSAGIGTSSAEQLFLDISQGSRVDDALYDRSLPHLGPFDEQVPDWSSIVDRAGDAPADLTPGLLASTLIGAGIPVRADPHTGEWALIAADEAGEVQRISVPGCSYLRRCPGLVVLPASIHKLKDLAYSWRIDHTDGLQGSDLLIGISRPDSHGASVIGIAAPSYFHDLRADWTRDLTSDSTRTDGFVLSTDIAPTILSRFGVEIPDEMDGEPIRPGAADTRPAVVDRALRVVAIPERRALDLILPLVGWIAAALLLGLWKPDLRRLAVSWLAVSFAYMPLLLLLGAAMRPNGFAEGMLIAFGAGGLAALTVWRVRGWGALSIACAFTLAGYAIDVLAGSSLTSLSLLGPNPIYGARFYGIGNELEALLAVMVPVGVGAGLTAAGGGWRSGRRAYSAFLIAAGLAAVVFAAGRFGADVGAAIVLPIGAAVAVAALSRSAGALYPSNGTGKAPRGLFSALVIAVPVAAVGALVLIDLVSGANAHLTRSVLDAGGPADLAEIADRRLTLSAHDFARAAANPLFWLLIAGVVVAAARWRRMHAWLQPFPAARAGLIGACAAVAVGVLVNDSGASFLVLGSLALGASLAFAWSQAGTNP